MAGLMIILKHFQTMLETRRQVFPLLFRLKQATEFRAMLKYENSSRKWLADFTESQVD